MFFYRVPVLGTVCLALSACGGVADLKTTMRDDHVSLIDHASFSTPLEASLTREAILLEERIQEVLTAARGNAGACSAMLGDPSMSKCAEGTLKGKWLGKLRGTGPVDPVSITPGIAAAHEQLSVVAQGTERMLNEQATEMALLRQGQVEGTLDPDILQARLSEMHQSRVAVADALALAAERSARTGRALQKAQDAGQTELDFYVRAVRDIETRSKAIADALSASLT